ncbi:hypothetical protein PISL3812_05323 [Talaromyces islandicus]|uniref:AB hydrolase-1 domain-containing protein n=1 Tax=Talaromyces islandicus TaxID=28573 RepID=A0A0U1LY72_TALIS|nr:hypothetical protein PISL3812_05323 [Talaromyces islandicus]
MVSSTTIQVPHLGGIKAGYALSDNRYDPSKPTVVMINSMCTTVALYKDQFEDKKLTAAVNLLAIEPLGHGLTSSSAEHFTYWDSAIMALQVMDKLGIKNAFALGTSQGGWIVVRMALLMPEKILGLLPLGTSMDYESAESRTLGAWEPASIIAPFVEKWTTTTETPEFVVDDVWCGMVASLGFSGAVSAETTTFWKEEVKSTYVGDEGRNKVRMASINLLSRDGLLLRLQDIKCPGTEDAPFGTNLPAEQIKLFASSKEAKLTIVQGGGHYLNVTSPMEVNESILDIVSKYAN